MGIFECLAISKKIGELILAKADSTVIRDQAIKEGMATMFQDGIRKAEAGTTTIEEVLRVILV
jgi:general secretion pathway protein E